MTTAIATMPKTKTAAQAAYSGERRTNAARWGWISRRWVPGPPDPETLARRRLEALLINADPALARLYACRVAESLAHHFTERYPSGPGCVQAIAAARRLARGEMSEWGRRKANTAARKLVSRAEVDTGCFSRPFFWAVNAAAWCTDRDVRRGVYWSLIWAADHAGYKDHAEALERYCDELALSATETGR